MAAGTTTTKTKAAPRRPVRKQDLKSLVSESTSITVSNQLTNIVCFNYRVDGGTDECEFQAKGDSNGDDTMELPSTILLNAKFRDAVSKGILKIVEADDPDVIEAFEAKNKAWAAQQEAKKQSDMFIESQQPKAFSGRQCLAQEGRGQCVEYAIYSTNSNERPPLCQKHAHLASQFVPEETGTFTNNKPDVEWRRVTTLGR